MKLTLLVHPRLGAISKNACTMSFVSLARSQSNLSRCIAFFQTINIGGKKSKLQWGLLKADSRDCSPSYWLWDSYEAVNFIMLEKYSCVLQLAVIGELGTLFFLLLCFYYPSSSR